MPPMIEHITEKQLIDRDYITPAEVRYLLDYFEIESDTLAKVCNCKPSTFDIYIGNNSTELPKKHQNEIIYFFLCRFDGKELENGEGESSGTDNSDAEASEPAKEPTPEPTPPVQSKNGSQADPDPDSDKQPFEILGEITADDIPPAGNFTKSKYEGIADRARELDVDKGFKVRVENSSAAGTVKKLFKRRFKERTFNVIQRKGGGTWRLYIIRKS